MVAFSQLPVLKAREVIRAFLRAGFIKHHQTGSHLVMKHPETGKRTVVPNHPRETLGKGLLTEIIEQAGLTIEEFLDLL